MINKQDVKILECLKDDLIVCENYLWEHKDDVQETLDKYSDLRVTIRQQINDSYLVYDEMFANDFIVKYLEVNCVYRMIKEQATLISNDTIANELIEMMLFKDDAKYNSINSFIIGLNDIMDVINKYLRTEKVIDTILIGLQDLTGTIFDEDSIICCFNNDIEVIVSRVEGQTSNFEGHGICQLYNAYYNEEDSDIYDIWVDEDDIIVDVN